MAKIVSKDFTLRSINVTSATVVMPPHQTGDVLLVFAGKDDATGTDPTTSTTGWLIGGQGVSGGATTAAVRCGWFIKVAESSAEPDLVISSSDSDTWSIISMAIRGAGITKTITTYSWSGGSTTYTSAGHGFTTGAIVNITGMTPSAANGLFKVTAVTTDTFTVVDADPGAYSAGGSAKCIVDNHTGNGSTDATGAPFAVTGLTTNYDNSLVVFACLSGGAGCPVHYPGIQRVDNVDTGTEGVGVAWMFKAAAGATGDWNFYTDATNTNTRGFAVAIRDSDEGYIPAYWDTDYATLIHPFRGATPIITSDVVGTALTNYPTLGKTTVSQVWQVDQSGGPAYTDYTTAANNSTDADVTPFPATEAAGAEGTGDWFAIGHTKPFQAVIFDRAGCTQGVAGVVAWEYWSASSGGSWVALTNVTDETTSFTSTLADTQVTKWELPTKFDWTPKVINGSASLYYVRARCSTVWTTNPTISQVYIGGASTVYDAAGSSTDAGVIQFENAMNVTPSSSVVNVGGTYMDLGQTVDLANKVIVGTYQFTLPRDYVDSARFKEGGGVHVFFADTSFNRKSWVVGSYLDKYTNDAQRNRFAIDWEQTVDTTHARTTTDPSDTIADVFIGNLAPRGAGSVAFSHMAAITPSNAVVNGGTATYPITQADLIALGDASPLQLFRDNLFMIPVTFGGSDPVSVVMDGFTIEFPQVATPWTDPYNVLPASSAHYDEGVLGFTFDCRAGDDMYLTNGKITSPSTWKFNMLSTCSASANWDFTGLIIENANVTMRDVYPWENVTFRSCPSFTTNDAEFISCTFTDSPLTVATLAGVEAISNSTFNSGGSGHAITVAGTASTIDLTNLTFSGYAASDGSTGDEAIYVNIASGTVTLNILGGTTPSVRTAGATIVKVINPVALSVHVQDVNTGSSISGARVWIPVTSSAGGKPYNASVTITNSGTTATVTHTAHGLSTGNYVYISGASHWQNNGTFSITKTGDNTYTYTMASAPGSNPTGTITATFVVINGTTDGSGNISATFSWSADQSVSGRVRKATTAPYYKTSPISGTISYTSGLSVTVPLIPDS